MQIVNDARIIKPVDPLGHGDEQRFHVLRVLDKVMLRHDIDQGTNGKVSSVFWM